MKIAVYSIAKDEEAFVERWAESAKDADLILLCDTGSTDKTRERAEQAGVHTVNATITPWRFDDARNVALAHIPADYDYCISLDLDEVLQPGWREALEACPPEVTRPRYVYTWSWNEDGSPGLQYKGDKIHARAGYRWRHPVHEVLTPYAIPEVHGDVALEIHHHPDLSKSRAQYAPMLAMAVAEDPTDDRNAYYYARELFFLGRYDDAADEFQRYLGLPKAVWRPERSAAMRYRAACAKGDRLGWLLMAAEEAPDRREAKVELAQYYYEIEDWPRCLEAVESALAITEKPLDYLCEAFAWSEYPYELGYMAAWNVGQKRAALDYWLCAYALNPDNRRVAANLAFFEVLGDSLNGDNQ